eukprot:scaffold7097_cov60-Phaeocystis_antarctica.AAC.4
MSAAASTRRRPPAAAPSDAGVPSAVGPASAGPNLCCVALSRRRCQRWSSASCAASRSFRKYPGRGAAPEWRTPVRFEPRASHHQGWQCPLLAPVEKPAFLPFGKSQRGC